MNAHRASRAFLFATAIAAAASLALPPLSAFAQTSGPADRANTQQGTAAGQMPMQGGGMGTGGSMSSGGSSSATTGPADKANTKQGTAATTGTKKKQQHHA